MLGLKKNILVALNISGSSHAARPRIDQGQGQGGEGHGRRRAGSYYNIIHCIIISILSTCSINHISYDANY